MDRVELVALMAAILEAGLQAGLKSADELLDVDVDGYVAEAQAILAAATRAVGTLSSSTPERTHVTVNECDECHGAGRVEDGGGFWHACGQCNGTGIVTTRTPVAV